MTITPPWLVVSDDAPRCRRCGAAWDRSLAAEADADVPDCVRADAVLRGLLAFAAAHAACPEPDEEELEPAAVPVPVAAYPRGHCPECGTRFKNSLYRHCYACHPQRGGLPARPPEPLGACPKCARPYNKRRRCYDCSPTPLMLRFRKATRNGKA